MRTEKVDGGWHVYWDDGAADDEQPIALFFDEDEMHEYLHHPVLIQRQGQLLTAAVNALRGDPPPDTSWSHHDVAERALDLVGTLEMYKHSIRRLQAEIAELRAK